MRFAIAVVAALAATSIAWVVRCPCGTGCPCGIFCRCPRHWSPWVELVVALGFLVTLRTIGRYRDRHNRTIGTPEPSTGPTGPC